jgi:hypothetical protein
MPLARSNGCALAAIIMSAKWDAPCAFTVQHSAAAQPLCTASVQYCCCLWKKTYLLDGPAGLLGLGPHTKGSGELAGKCLVKVARPVGTHKDTRGGCTSEQSQQPQHRGVADHGHQHGHCLNIDARSWAGACDLLAYCMHSKSYTTH